MYRGYVIVYYPVSDLSDPFLSSIFVTGDYYRQHLPDPSRITIIIVCFNQLPFVDNHKDDADADSLCMYIVTEWNRFHKRKYVHFEYKFIIITVAQFIHSKTGDKLSIILYLNKWTKID